MALTTFDLHDVTSVRFAVRYASNGGARTIQFGRADGSTIDITVYGKTEDVEGLPKALDFRDADAGSPAPAAE